MGDAIREVHLYVMNLSQNSMLKMQHTYVIIKKHLQILHKIHTSFEIILYRVGNLFDLQSLYRNLKIIV
jgi:hypothetical protein